MFISAAVPLTYERSACSLKPRRAGANFHGHEQQREFGFGAVGSIGALMRMRFLRMVVMGACFLAALPARGQQNGGSRQTGDGATKQREVSPAAPRGTSQKAKFQPGPDLSAAKQLPEVQNPRATQLDSAALSVLQSQRQA